MNLHRLAALAFIAGTSIEAADYPMAVQTDSPLAYYRFNDDPTRSHTHQNSGTIGAAGNATNLNVHPYPGGLSGDPNRSTFFDSTARSIIPWHPGLNPSNNQPFTVEAWFYPASDQINPGQAVIMNRYSYPNAVRQGWVIFQRAPDISYAGKPGFEGVGWNFRMYRASGGSSGLDVVSQVPYQLGKWTQVVTVYDPVDGINPALTMYINGVAAATNTWTGAGPGYVANTDDHDPAEALNGPAGLSFGQYNNTQPGGNPYFGAVDEFAFYTNKLTAAQIMAHYQNGTNTSRTTPYRDLVLALNPTAYLRLDELTPGPDIALNLGDARASGVATHTAEVRHPATSALAGEPNDGSVAYHFRNGSATTTMPWLAANNPPAGTPFTFETWLRPMSDRQGGQSPFNNRWVGGSGRTGWVIFQRNPNLTYPASEGHGWNFRMFSGLGTGGQDVLTRTDYTVGEWQHLVVTWEPQIDNGDPGANGNNQWQGILTAYVNGIPVASNTAARYAANREITETGVPAADLAIGSYNAASVLGNNPYEGDVDEFAFYNGYVLSPAQILEHYQARTNAHPSTNYATLVLSAASDGAGTQRLMPATYLRFNDPAYYPATNSGSLGFFADGNLVVASNRISGPVLVGFETNNRAVFFDGLKSWASFNNPPGLNISNRITLEAWIMPDPVQESVARIISHGPPTLSSFLAQAPETNAAPTVAPEVFLRMEGSAYVAGSSDGTNTYSASAAIPAADLAGTNWVHLVGTYDGANWKVFRNGVEVASAAAAIGALPVTNADWAVGSTGNGWAEKFAGGIDEVAIYATALTPARILTHYTAGQSGLPLLRLNISHVGSTVTITWSSGVLQESTNVLGTYTDVPGNPPSPYTFTASGRKFYRLRL